MSYVIRRGDGAYVAAPPITGSSYTRDITRAHTFGTIEWARMNACGNESIYQIDTSATGFARFVEK